MTSNSTTLIVRLPKELKEDFEDICSQNGTNLSDVTRTLVQHYVQGMPTTRELLETISQSFQKILNILEEKNDGKGKS